MLPLVRKHYPDNNSNFKILRAISCDLNSIYLSISKKHEFLLAIRIMNSTQMHDL